MSTSVKDGTVKRDGSVRLRSQKGVPILEETYSFLVVATSKSESYLSVIGTAGLPVVGLTLSPSGFGICQTKNATRRTDNPYYWDVTCEFSSNVDENTGGNQNDPYTSPTAWIPVYETKFERLQEVATVDANGDPIANSAGQAFPDGITVTRKIPVWEFFQFEPATVSDQTIIDRSETVNNATFKGRAENTLFLTVLSSVIGFYYGTRLRLTQYQLKYNRKNWLHKRLDVGTVYFSGSALLPYADDDGNVIMGSLDGGGGKVTAGDPPAVLEFAQYPSLDFGTFLRI